MRIRLYQKVSSRLEADLSGKLQVQWLTGADPWSPVEISNRVTHNPVRAYRTSSGCEVLAAEDIEHFSSKLQLQSLFDRDILDHGQIHVGETRTIKRIPVDVTRGIGWAGASGRARCTESSGVHPWDAAKGQIEFVGDTSKRICYEVQPWALGPSIEVERLPSVEGPQSIELPAMGQDFGPV